MSTYYKSPVVAVYRDLSRDYTDIRSQLESFSRQRSCAEYEPRTTLFHIGLPVLNYATKAAHVRE